MLKKYIILASMMLGIVAPMQAMFTQADEAQLYTAEEKDRAHKAGQILELKYPRGYIFCKDRDKDFSLHDDSECDDCKLQRDIQLRRQILNYYVKFNIAFSKHLPTEAPQILGAMLADTDEHTKTAEGALPYHKAAETLAALYPDDYSWGCTHQWLARQQRSSDGYGHQSEQNPLNCTEPKCFAKEVMKRKNVVVKQLRNLYQPQSQEALSDDERALLPALCDGTDEFLQQTPEEQQLRKLYTHLISDMGPYSHDDKKYQELSTRLTAIHGTLQMKEETRKQKFEGTQSFFHRMNPEEDQAIVDRILAGRDPLFQTKTERITSWFTPGAQPISGQTSAPRTVARLSWIAGAGMSLTAATKAYNAAHKEIVTEHKTAQEKAKKDGSALIPAMTKWQLRKAALKRALQNVRKQPIKKQKQLAAGLTLFVGGGLYDLASSLLPRFKRPANVYQSFSSSSHHPFNSDHQFHFIDEE